MNIAGKWLSVASNIYDVTLVVAPHGPHLSGSASIPAAEAIDSNLFVGLFTDKLIGRCFKIVVLAPRSTDGALVNRQYIVTVDGRHIGNALATDPTTKRTPTPASWVGYDPKWRLKV